MSNGAYPGDRRPQRSGPAIGAGESMPYLMSMLAHDDPAVRRRAAGTLGRLHDAEALDSLVIALHDGDRLVQQAVIGALGAIGDPRAIPSLRQLSPRVDRRLRLVIEDAQRTIAAQQSGDA